MLDEPDRKSGVPASRASAGVWNWVLYSWIALYGIAVLPGIVFELTGQRMLWRDELAAHQPGVTWIFLGGLLAGLIMAEVVSLTRKVLQR